ncbi:MAG: hypothetical protein ACO1OF_03585 [Adhaeribacter sp.]
MLSDKEFEDLIRQKMAAHDEAPPTNGWKKIAADIRPPKKRRPIWWWVGPLLLLLTGLGIYYFYNKPVVKPAETTTTISNKENKTGVPALANVNPKPEKKNSSTATNNNQLKRNKIAEPGSTPQKNQSITIADNFTTPTRRKPAIKSGSNRSYSSTKEVAGNRNNKPTAPININGFVPGISPDSEEPQKEQPQTIIAKPATVATDSVNKFVGTVKPDTAQIAAKQDSVTSENKVLAQEQKAEEKKDKPKIRNWEAGFTFATRYAFRKFTPNATDNIFITDINTRNQNQPERLGYEFGFNVARALTDNFYVETGIAWLQLKENLTYTYTTGTIDTIVVTATPGQTNINPVYKMEERQLASSYAYGGWRLGATYYFWNNGRRRFNFSVAGGVNLLVRGVTEEYRNGQFSRKVVFPSRANILEQANYNLLVGAGYNTRLGQKLDLMLMPSLNYFMGSTFKEREPLGLRPYSLGLNIALKRRFSRQN